MKKGKRFLIITLAVFTLAIVGIALGRVAYTQAMTTTTEGVFDVTKKIAIGGHTYINISNEDPPCLECSPDTFEKIRVGATYRIIYESNTAGREHKLIKIERDKLPVSQTESYIKKIAPDDAQKTLLKFGYSPEFVTICPAREVEEISEVIKKSPEKVAMAEAMSGLAKKMKYTQTVINNSTAKKPMYNVKLYFSWKPKVGRVPYFNDRIAVAWGGNLNRGKMLSKRIRYQNMESYYGLRGKTYYSKYYSPGVSDTPNKGVIFSAKQFRVFYKNGKKQQGILKNGYMSFNLYQNKKQGYDTRIISRYCYRKIKIGSSISFTGSGASVGIEIGTGYEKSPQRTRTIRY